MLLFEESNCYSIKFNNLGPHNNHLNLYDGFLIRYFENNFLGRTRLYNGLQGKNDSYSNYIFIENDSDLLSGIPFFVEHTKNLDAFKIYNPYDKTKYVFSIKLDKAGEIINK